MQLRTRAGIACLAILLLMAPAAWASNPAPQGGHGVLDPFGGAFDWLLQQLDSWFDTSPMPSEDPPEDPPPNDPPPPPPDPDPGDEKGGNIDPGG